MCVKMNFPRQGFEKVSYHRHTDTLNIIYHAALRVVSNVCGLVGVC